MAPAAAGAGVAIGAERLPYTELTGDVLKAVHFGTWPPDLSLIADALCDMRLRLQAAEAARDAAVARAGELEGQLQEAVDECSALDEEAHGLRVQLRHLKGLAA